MMYKVPNEEERECILQDLNQAMQEITLFRKQQRKVIPLFCELLDASEDAFEMSGEWLKRMSRLRKLLENKDTSFDTLTEAFAESDYFAGVIAECLQNIERLQASVEENGDI